MNPLSADYVPLTPQAPTTALAFDLRKLGPDVNADLIIQEQSTSGSSYDKPYLRIKLTHARFALCGMADGMGPVQGYLILSNHSMTATVNGSMTVQTQSACAKTATEQYSSNSTLGPVVGPSFVETAAVMANGMSWKASPTAFGMKYKSGTGTVTVSDADQNYEGDCSGQGSFNAKAIESDADLDAWGYYQNGIVYGSYSAPPLDVAYPWRSSWTFPVTCPDETLSVPAWGGATGCPKPAGGISWNTGTWVDDHHTRFSFNCTGTGSAGTNEPLAVTITGYATATGVIPCGAWTTREQGVNCPVDGAYPYSAS